MQGSCMLRNFVMMHGSITQSCHVVVTVLRDRESVTARHWFTMIEGTHHLPKPLSGLQAATRPNDVNALSSSMIKTQARA